MASATAKALSRVAVAQERGQVGEMDFDQALVHQQPPDAAHAVGEEVVGDLEGLQHAGVLIDQLEHLLVGQADDAVGRGFEFRQALLRQALPAAAFAIEGRRDKPQHQGAGLLGRARQHRADARARAAAQAGHDENHVRALAERLEPRQMFLGQRAAAVGVAAGAQPAQELRFQVEIFRGGGGREGCGVGVDRHEADAGQAAP